MEYKELKSLIIAMIVMIATLGALCTATPAMAFEQYTPCDYLDQDVLMRYDFDNNGLIDGYEMEKAYIGYDSKYETQDDYEQIKYAYEHSCHVGSTLRLVVSYPVEASFDIENRDIRGEMCHLVIQLKEGGRVFMNTDCEDRSITGKWTLEFDGTESWVYGITAYGDTIPLCLNSGGIAELHLPDTTEYGQWTSTITPTAPPSQPIATAQLTPTPEPTPIPTLSATHTPTKPMFRVGPTVVLRPVDDVINKSQNGIVELYMNNPSLNDVTLTADIQISVPSGIHISGDGFGYGGAAGVVAGTFTVPPGTVRTININIMGEKIGVFNIHFTGLYWADGDKDAFQQVSLTHRLTVTDPDVIETPVLLSTEVNTPLSDTVPINNTESDSIPTMYIIIGMGIMVAMLIIIIAARK